MNSRLTSIIRKEFIQILRDSRTLIMVVVLPIMELLLLGYATTTVISNISMAVWDQNQTTQFPPARQGAYPNWQDRPY